MKKVLWLVVAVAVVGLIVWMNGEQKTAPAEDSSAQAEIETQQATKGANVLTGAYGLAGVEWVFTQTKEGDGLNAPLVQARVQPVGVTRPDGRPIEVSTWRLGEQQGSCAVMAKPADEQISALSYAQCWWAGGGNQFRAVRDGNLLRVDVRPVDEMETAPATFKQLVVIDLASIAQ